MSGFSNSSKRGLDLGFFVFTGYGLDQLVYLNISIGENYIVVDNVDVTINSANLCNKNSITKKSLSGTVF